MFSIEFERKEKQECFCGHRLKMTPWKGFPKNCERLFLPQHSLSVKTNVIRRNQGSSSNQEIRTF